MQQRPRPKQQPKKNEGLMVCIDRHPYIVESHRDGMFYLKCSIESCTCRAGFPEDHIYFNHRAAKTQPGDHVILPGYQEKPAEREVEKLTPEVNIGNIKLYFCKICRCRIDEQQARDTFNQVGTPLCPHCASKY